MNLPLPFLRRMQEMLGDQYPAFLASYDLEPAKGLRINRRGKGMMPAWLQGLEPIPYEPDGYYCPAGLGVSPLHHGGAYYLQDPSAMIVANAIDLAGDECVLDMCAAPGGKSTQLAARLPHGTLVSNEIDLGRAKTLLGNIERMGYDNVVVTSMTPAAVADTWAGLFDVVVVDAPCSGEGMFRKTPAAIDEWSEDNVTMCAARQRDILHQAVRCLKPGGKLVYSTCTFSPRENEENISYLTHTYPLHSIPTTPRVQAATVEGIAPLTRRFYPHLGVGEGHFVAVLQLEGESKATSSPAYTQDTIAKAEQAILRRFLQQSLYEVPQGALCPLGEDVVLYKGSLPLPKTRGGLLCAGVKVGSIVKGRVEPHHMAFRCLPWRNSLSLPLDDPRVAAYLHGEAISLHEGEDMGAGWGVLCVEGWPLGGVKNVDGLLKNHYPKGLRC